MSKVKLEANKLLQHHLNSLFDQPFKHFQGVKYRNIFKYSVPFKERFCTLQKCASLLNVSVMILITAKGEFQSTGIKLSENLIHFSSSLKITQFIGVPDFISQVCFMTSFSILYSNTTDPQIKFFESSKTNTCLGRQTKKEGLGCAMALV